MLGWPESGCSAFCKMDTVTSKAAYSNSGISQNSDTKVLSTLHRLSFCLILVMEKVFCARLPTRPGADLQVNVKSLELWACFGSEFS